MLRLLDVWCFSYTFQVMYVSELRAAILRVNVKVDLRNQTQNHWDSYQSEESAFANLLQIFLELKNSLTTKKLHGCANWRNCA